MTVGTPDRDPSVSGAAQSANQSNQSIRVKKDGPERQWLRTRITEVGTEPDARFTFANERTFLAWNRTALGTMVAGLGLIHLLREDGVTPVGARLADIGLMAIASILSVVSYFHWQRCEIAMRKNDPLPHSWVMPVLAIGTGIAAMVAAISSL